MSHDIWRVTNTKEVLVTASLITGTLACRELVTTVTTASGGRDRLYRGEGAGGCWFSLRAGHHRPTICDHIAEGSQGILVAKVNVGNCVVWCGRFLNRSRLVVGKGPDFVFFIIFPALVHWMFGFCIKPVLLSTLIPPSLAQVQVGR